MTQSTEPRVVVGLDGSAESLAALDWAADYAQQAGRELAVVVAWHVPTPYTEVIDVADLEVAADDAVLGGVERACSRHPGLHVAQRVLAGAPGKVLVGEAGAEDVLVVGTRRTLGSVSSYCAHYASCTVVIVRTPGP